MKIKPNDPRITAFALGELTGTDAILIARAMRTDAHTREAVDEVRKTSRILAQTLGGEEIHHLTTDQHAAIRSAGNSPVITDIASARTPFWKSPAITGIGAAAALALTFYIIGGQPFGNDNSQETGGNEIANQWKWSQVKMDQLTAPAALDHLTNKPATGQNSEAAHPVSSAINTAISDDTPSYRQELAKRIGESNLEKAHRLPELKNTEWQNVTANQQLTLPMASGAATWPWLKRYIEEQKALPPKQAVRIEEMVNHFRYKQPTMLKDAALKADLELCITPWNPNTLLLAIHISAQENATSKEIETAAASLQVNPEHITRLRLLGYSSVKKPTSPAHQKIPPQATPMQLSRTLGNYVIYQLELKNPGANTTATPLPIITLNLGGKKNLANGQITSWQHASPDLRFASTITAAGILLTSTLPEDLDTKQLLTLINHLEKQNPASLVRERRAALQLLKKATTIMEAAVTQ